VPFWGLVPAAAILIHVRRRLDRPERLGGAGTRHAATRRAVGVNVSLGAEVDQRGRMVHVTARGRPCCCAPADYGVPVRIEAQATSFIEATRQANRRIVICEEAMGEERHTPTLSV
jgi:hypothetical protein